MRVASLVLRQPGLASRGLVDGFIVANTDVGDGVSSTMIKKFISFTQVYRALLSCLTFRHNKLTVSLNSVDDLASLQLSKGLYVVGVACQQGLRRCFFLSDLDDGDRSVHDDLTEETDHEFSTEPLAHLQWVGRVLFFRQVTSVHTKK